MNEKSQKGVIALATFMWQQQWRVSPRCGGRYILQTAVCILNIKFPMFEFNMRESVSSDGKSVIFIHRSKAAPLRQI